MFWSIVFQVLLHPSFPSPTSLGIWCMKRHKRPSVGPPWPVLKGTGREACFLWKMQRTCSKVSKKCNTHTETHTRIAVIYPRPETILPKCRFATLLWFILAKWTKPPKSSAIRQDTEKKWGGRQEFPHFLDMQKKKSNLLFFFKTNLGFIWRNLIYQLLWYELDAADKTGCEGGQSLAQGFVSSCPSHSPHRLSPCLT